MGACFMKTSSLNSARVRTLCCIITQVSMKMFSHASRVTSPLTYDTRSSCMEVSCFDSFINEYTKIDAYCMVVLGMT